MLCSSSTLVRPSTRLSAVRPAMNEDFSHHFVTFNDLSMFDNNADVIHGPPLTGSWYLTTDGWSSHGSGPARIWSWHWNNYFLERFIISFWSVSHSQTHYRGVLTNIESFCYCLVIILELTRDSKGPRDRRRCCRSACWSRRIRGHCAHCICRDENFSEILNEKNE